MLSESRRSLRKKRKKKSWLRRILFIAILIFLIVFGVGAYLFYQAYDAAQESFAGLDRGGKSDLREEKVTFGKDPISILLEGIENYSTNGKNGRADTDIVVTLNPDTHKMTMVSIPRDTMVDFEDKLPEYPGSHKINAAHALGELSGYSGNKLQVEVVEDLLDIPIDKYVSVDFEGFVGIVDALDGVPVDVKKGFWEKNIFNHDKRIYFEQGRTNMGGEEALAFVRMRKRAVNVSYSRDERQRQFIKAALRDAISAGTIFKVDKITDILGEHVKTNLKPKEIYGLEKAYSSMKPGAIETLKLKHENRMVNGKSYEILNEESLNEVKQKLKQSLEFTVSDEPDASSDGSDSETESVENKAG